MSSLEFASVCLGLASGVALILRTIFTTTLQDEDGGYFSAAAFRNVDLWLLGLGLVSAIVAIIALF